MLNLEEKSRIQPVQGMQKLVNPLMKIHYSKLDKFCRVCGGDHDVVIIPLEDGSRRVISPPFPDTVTKLARLRLKLKRGQEREGP
jgi:hypothetical protein